MSLTAAPASTNIPDPKRAVDILLSDNEVPENAPPTYKEAVSELVTNLQKKMAENPDALHAEFAKAFRSNEVDQIFQQRMNQLVESATIINKGFESVATATLTFDLKKYKKSDGTAIRAFAPDWKILKDRYTNLMWESRTFATTIKKRVTDYFKIILPMLKRDNVTDEEKLRNINYFLGISDEKSDNTSISEKLKKDEKEAERIARGFETLRTDVAAFSTSLKQAVEDAQAGMKKEVTDLQSKVATLEAKLKGYTAARNGMAIGFGVGAAVSGLALWGGLAATGILAPIALVSAAITALVALGLGIASAVEHFKLIAETQSQLDAAKLNLQIALARQKELDEVIKPQIDQALGATDDICTQLGNFAGIFTHIRMDAQSAREKLQSAIDSQAPALFRESSIDLATAAYERLELSLTMYANGFDKIGFAPTSK